jgi:hypothetical protein
LQNVFRGLRSRSIYRRLGAPKAATKTETERFGHSLRISLLKRCVQMNNSASALKIVADQSQPKNRLIRPLADSG